MRVADADILIVPGLRGSGPTHWQSWLASQLPDCARVEQTDWTRTCLSDWAARVRLAIDRSPDKVWIVAHSFGCLASVTAAFVRRERIHGALLVAPADPDRFGEPQALLDEPLGFPSLVVSSSNDPWVKASTAEYWAQRWGSRFLNIGPAGHINVDSGHGPWQQGMHLFKQLQASPAIDEKLISIE